MKRIITTLAFIVITSCASIPQQLASMPPSGKYEALGEGTCRACSFLLFSYIPIAFSSMPYRAHYWAVNMKGGEYLIKPSVYESWYYAVVGNVYCTTVSGTVIKEKR